MGLLIAKIWRLYEIIKSEYDLSSHECIQILLDVSQIVLDQKKLKTMIIQDTDRVLFWLEILAHCLPPEEEEEDMWEAQ